MKILVIGVAFTDIKGFSLNKYDPVGTNPGSVYITHGGAARNVAEDLSHLGADVDFALMLDDNPLGEDIRNRLEGAGVRLDHAVSVPGGGIGMWLAVFDENGDLAGSVSKMPEAEPLEKLLETKGEALFNDADAVVVEFDVSEKVAVLTCELSRRLNKPMYVIVGNMSVILSRRELMKNCGCVIMNEIEGSKFFAVELRRLEAREVLDKVWERGKSIGLNSLILTMGEQGCVYADYLSGERGCVPSFPCKTVDTTGAGDAFFSAAVITLTKGRTLKTACENGARIASRVVESKQSTCPADCRELLE